MSHTGYAIMGNILEKKITIICQKDLESGKPFNSDTLTGTVLDEKPKVKKPSMYKVIMLNDDYTPMEFVVEMLQTYFSKSSEEATKIMLHVHQKGIGICGLYTYEIAESKAHKVLERARKDQHPLQLKVEKE